MNQPAILICALFAAWNATAQSEKRMPIKVPGAERPTCTRGAICFSGEVSRGGEFSKTLNTALVFKLESSWQIAIIPTRPEGYCIEFASVVNGPYRAHRDLLIDASYEWTAEQEVHTSPREFRFVTNCADYRTEYERLLIVLGSSPATRQKYEEAMTNLGTTARGKGRLWITDSKVSHTDDTSDDKLGKIEWMKFSVEIVLPRSK